MSVIRGPKIAGKGLLACFDANNPNSYPGSGNTWYDLSPHGNHATFNSTPTWHQESGYFTFDESYNCLFTIPTGLSLFPNSNYTYEICARSIESSGTENKQALMFSNMRYNNYDGIMFVHNAVPNKMQCYLGPFADGIGGYVTDTQGVPNDTQIPWNWMIFFCRLDNRFPNKRIDVNVYSLHDVYNLTDGALRVQPTGFTDNGQPGYDAFFNNSGDKYGIANDCIGTSRWNGDIAYVRVYDRMLTDQELAGNVSSFRERFER